MDKTDKTDKTEKAGKTEKAKRKRIPAYVRNKTEAAVDFSAELEHEQNENDGLDIATATSHGHDFQHYYRQHIVDASEGTIIMLDDGSIRAKVLSERVGDIKLDIGCGTRKEGGFIGIDNIKFAEVDVVMDAGISEWPFADGSVSFVKSSHFVEHLTAQGRVTFVNELWRILADGASAQIIVPHWASCRAYGDPTHQWPPVSEFWFYYLSDEWRRQNAPHTDLDMVTASGGCDICAPLFQCNFEATWAYTMGNDLAMRSAETQQFALQNYKEAAQDIIATLTKRPLRPVTATANPT